MLERVLRYIGRNRPEVELEAHGGHYYTMVLTGLPEDWYLSRPERMWTFPRGHVGDNITLKTHGITNYRIKEALDGHRDSVLTFGDHGDDDAFVYPYLLLHMNSEQWAADAATGGARLMRSIMYLEKRILADFGLYLPPGRIPRCGIIGRDDVEKGSIVINFGRSVYIPDRQDDIPIVARVSVMNGSNCDCLPDFYFFDESLGIITRPAGIYKDQPLVVLSSQKGDAPFRLSALPDDVGRVVIGVRDGLYSIINPLISPVEAQSGIRKYILQEGAGESIFGNVEVRIEDLRGTESYDTETPLVLEEPEVVELKGDHQSKAETPFALAYQSAGLYRVSPKLLSWQLAFDAAGNSIEPGASEAVGKFALRVGSSMDNVMLYQTEGKPVAVDEKRLPLPIIWPSGKQTLFLPVQFQMQKRFIAELRLPSPGMFPLASGVIHLLGRQMQDGDDAPATIKLPGLGAIIETSDAARHYGDCFLSRKQAALRVDETTQTLLVRQLSLGASMFVIRTDGRVEEVPPLCEETEDQVCTLNVNDTLVAGCYFMSFVRTGEGLRDNQPVTFVG
jgi:hypothetical protein